MEALMQFGVAGLMGALWVWERRYSRRREDELTQAHDKLMEQHRHLESLVTLVRTNTRAMVESERTGKRMCDLLKGIVDELRENKRAA
ncbi:MAG: hypothetical protein WD294_10445 [Phycisphaeraceae bacterium]